MPPFFSQIWSAARRLALGLALIVIASAVLLLSDRGQRTRTSAAHILRIAIVQHASTPVLDEGVRGMVVWGLASIIIGEALVGVRQLGLLIAGGILGSVLFRLLVAIALRGGLDPNDLKLVTAVFVFAALVLPQMARHAASLRQKRAA